MSGYGADEIRVTLYFEHPTFNIKIPENMGAREYLASLTKYDKEALVLEHFELEKLRVTANEYEYWDMTPVRTRQHDG